MPKLPSLAAAALIGLTLPAPLLTTPADAAEALAAEQSTPFEQWLEAFTQKARNAGIEGWVLEQAFTGLTPDSSIIRADESQPEFTRPVWQYLKGALSSWRIARGKALLAEHKRTLDSIEKRYGVDRYVLVAIWGMESNFGRQMGDKNIIRSLATLAWHGRRAAFWEDQLMAALRILQNGDISSRSMVGSWAGAMGQTQFMPTTYLEHAVDFDGNGKRDIWNSSADALASAANYLNNSGWQADAGWGYEVQLPTLFDHALADGEHRKSLAQWLELGVQLRQPTALSKDQLQLQASIFLPAGYRGPAYLQLDNFRSILRYNNSTAYALAVGLLANGLQGEHFSLQRWPTEDRPLSRSERLELQHLLNELGLATGTADGIIGVNTRKAIRGFQKQHDLPQDGYASERLLEALRSEAAVLRTKIAH
ncbi:MAG: lytic murein transglycosylase [Thiopseudomonas sp.]